MRARSPGLPLPQGGLTHFLRNVRREQRHDARLASYLPPLPRLLSNAYGWQHLRRRT